jgi:hypothetical protein
MSVHGNAFCSQQDAQRTSLEDHGWHYYDVPDQGTPWGWGRTFVQTGWYHVPVPTIIDFDSQSMYVHEVLIQMDRRNMHFDEVHMWHGGEFFWTGPASGELVRSLLFQPRDSSGQRMSARAGLGISLHFTKTPPDGFVTFNSALVVIQSTR